MWRRVQKSYPKLTFGQSQVQRWLVSCAQSFGWFQAANIPIVKLSPLYHESAAFGEECLKLTFGWFDRFYQAANIPIVKLNPLGILGTKLKGEDRLRASVRLRVVRRIRIVRRALR